MSDNECEWAADIPPRSPKLQYFGKYFQQRFMDMRSSLHPEQREALKAVVNWFSNEEKQDLTAVVVMPTGTGKSGVICCLPYSIGAAIEEKRIASDQIQLSKPILIIAPSLVIMKQLEESLSPNGFLKKRSLLKKTDIEQNALYGTHMLTKSEEVKQLGKKSLPEIVLSNSQKWRKEEDGTPIYADLQEDLFSMVIVDEAHHLPASQWQEIINQFKSHAKIVFFTATPYRTDEREITTDHAIHTKGFAYKLSRKDAIKKRLIRDIKCLILHKLPAEKRMKIDDDIQEMQQNGYQSAERMKYAEKVLVEVKNCMIKKNEMNPLPCNKKHASIIIAKNIDETKKIRKLCTEKLGFAENQVAVVHGKAFKNREMKEKAIKEIHDGNVEIVVIVKMLLEGFDYPPFSIAGIVTSIRTSLKLEQFIGRVQRIVREKDEDGRYICENDNIMADIITHEYFEQEHLLEEYENPHIAEKEDPLMDKEILQPDEDSEE